MGEPSPTPQDRPEAARAGYTASVVASGRCPACQGELPPGRKACSGKCRALLSRERRAESYRRREQGLEARVQVLEKANRELLAVIRAVGWLAKVTDGRHGGGDGLAGC